MTAPSRLSAVEAAGAMVEAAGEATWAGAGEATWAAAGEATWAVLDSPATWAVLDSPVLGWEVAALPGTMVEIGTTSITVTSITGTSFTTATSITVASITSSSSAVVPGGGAIIPAGCGPPVAGFGLATESKRLGTYQPVP